MSPRRRARAKFQQQRRRQRTFVLTIKDRHPAFSPTQVRAFAQHLSERLGGARIVVRHHRGRAMPMLFATRSARRR